MDLIEQEDMDPRDFRTMRWGSHIPLNQSLIEAFPITGVLELGAGLYSTKMFFDLCPMVTSIENDLKWIQGLRSDPGIKEDDLHKIIHHDIPSNIKVSTLPSEIPNLVLDSAIRFYEAHMDQRMNFLFVDCYAGFRMPALNSLHHKFDIICYHDTEDKFKWQYEYDQFKPSKDHLHFMDRTFDANSGYLISKELAHLITKFTDTYAKNAEAYARRFNCKHRVALIAQ